MSDMLNVFLDAPTIELPCVKACKKYGVSCPNAECKSWMNYEEDLNCTFVAVDKHERGMTLREIGERLHISFVRVCQIEKAAIQKIKKRMEKPPCVK